MSEPTVQSILSDLNGEGVILSPQAIVRCITTLQARLVASEARVKELESTKEALYSTLVDERKSIATLTEAVKKLPKVSGDIEDSYYPVVFHPLLALLATMGD